MILQIIYEIWNIENHNTSHVNWQGESCMSNAPMITKLSSWLHIRVEQLHWISYVNICYGSFDEWCQSIIYSKIKAILHSFIGDQGWFADGVEPTKNQIYSIGRLRYRKVDVKKVGSLDNTHEFGQKIVHYLTLPEKELESYVASTYIHANIQDENNDEEVRFVIIFTSKWIYRLLHGAGDGAPSTKAEKDIFWKYFHPDWNTSKKVKVLE